MNEHTLCPACKRHVRTSEEQCPFCTAAIPAEARIASPLPPVPRGSSRARVFALNAALATGAATGLTAGACDETTTAQNDASARDGGTVATGQDAAGGQGGGDMGGTGGRVSLPPYGCAFPCETAKV